MLQRCSFTGESALTFTGGVAKLSHLQGWLEDVALSTMWVLTHTAWLARDVCAVVLFSLF